MLKFLFYNDCGEFMGSGVGKTLEHAMENSPYFPHVLEQVTQYETEELNQYEFLELYLDEFWKLVFDKSLDESWNGGIIGAHGDKGYGYRSSWEEAGIPFNEGMMVYLLTYTSKMDEEKHNSREWVIKHYPTYKPLIDKAIESVNNKA